MPQGSPGASVKGVATDSGGDISGGEPSDGIGAEGAGEETCGGGAVTIGACGGAKATGGGDAGRGIWAIGGAGAVGGDEAASGCGGVGGVAVLGVGAAVGGAAVGGAGAGAGSPPPSELLSNSVQPSTPHAENTLLASAGRRVVSPALSIPENQYVAQPPLPPTRAERGTETS